MGGGIGYCGEACKSEDKRRESKGLEARRLRSKRHVVGRRASASSIIGVISDCVLQLKNADRDQL